MPQKVSGKLIALAALLVVGGGALFLWQQNRAGHRRVLEQQQETFQRAVKTVAAAEDARYEEAIAGWIWLVQRHPNDEELLLNQAVTVLKWIEETSSLLNSGALTDAQQQQRKDELTRALAEADRIVSQIANSTADVGLKAFLESAILEAKSRQLAYPEDIAVRKQAAERISLALAQNPAQALLACKLDDLAQEFSADNEQLAKATADSVLASWEASPRNLYLLVRAGELLLEQQDARLAEVLDASLDLSKPMMSMLAPSLAKRNPADLVATAKQSIADNQWSGAQQSRLWFNVLKSSTAFRPDMRLVKPDIMALLSTSFLQKWRNETPEAVAKSQQPAIETPFRSVAVNAPDGTSPSTLVHWYDHDLDGKFELLVAGGRELRLLNWDTLLSRVNQVLKIDVPFSIEGLLAVDLFEVDSTQRPRVSQSVAELMTTETPLLPAEQASPDRSSGHDTIQELIVWGAESVALVTSRESEPGAATRTLELISEVDGLTQLRGILNIEPLDMDSDGDLDLFVTTGSGMRFLQNNGNRTFQDVSQFSSLPTDGWLPEQVVACDYDRDLDIDIIGVSKSDPHVAVLENILHNQFRFAGLTTGAWLQSGPLSRVSVAELDGNGSWDWCFLAEDSVSSVFTRTADDRSVTADRGESISLTAARELELADINNDSSVDAIVGTVQGIDVYYGTALGYFQSTPSKLLGSGAVTAIDSIDANGDGTIEIAAIVDGRPVLLQASTEPEGVFVEARLRGINDVNGGGRINHYAVGSVVEVWSANRFQAQVVQKPIVHFGLGNQPPINLRIVFNNGLTQNVESIEPNTLVLERQELKGSCPFVYGWNGQRFELITDLLWNAPLGLQVARGKAMPDRRWEYLVLPGSLVQPRDGAYELRLTEELWEIAYFDHIALTAVDHPISVAIFNNEKVGPAEIAQPKLFPVTQKIYPMRAVDTYGRDCLKSLECHDRIYVQPFERQICQGLCEPHFIELEFGDPIPVGAKLFLTGWLHPTDTSLNIAIDQNSDLELPEPPSLWVADERGEFKCAQPFIGFPGGKPKSIVVDLQGVLESNVKRLRIAGSQQIYWDEAFITVEQPPVPIRTTELNLNSAVFGYRGFSRLLPRSPDQPHWYDYHSVSTAPKWPPLDGPYTRYGEIAQLLRENDDRMVIMGSGDEVVLRFAIPSQKLPNGWTRDFVLHSVGWDKDADMNTLAGQSSAPLPFRMMEAYPPPASQESEAKRIADLNAPTLIERRSAATYWRQPSRNND